MTERPPRASRLRFWPWLVLALTTLPAVWYVFDYEDDIDPELPRVVRPTFSRYPPPAYRFAEACDTIDHSAVYVSSAALVLAAWGWLRKPSERLWAAALALSAAGFWHAATPAPLADGWYGLGWRTIFDPRAPASQRLILATLAAGVATFVIRALLERPVRLAPNTARSHGILGLLIAAAILMIMRQIGWLDREPFGFWPRWFYVWGLFAWAFALVKVVPPAPARWPRALIVGFMVLISLGLDFTGRGLFWYQRPIARLREMEPGRLYLSAMPTYLGLQLAQERYHFRTIIDLYPEYTSEQSPHWQDERRFIREHDLKYVFNESHDGTAGDDFIAHTLELARQPENWPVLVHCHASMDRSPAWVGIYRFVLQGWPLIDVLREIERHRGLRPKAAVTVLYTHILPKIAPERCAHDPTFALLKKCAAGADGPEAEVASRSRPENRPDRTHR